MNSRINVTIKVGALLLVSAVVCDKLLEIISELIARASTT